MYSAESVVAALKANDELNCEGIDTIYCPSSHEGCPGNPDGCALCLTQKCKQAVSVHRDYKRLVKLHFYFMISKQNHGGFIRKGDSELQKLIDRKYVNETTLETVK